MWVLGFAFWVFCFFFLGGGVFFLFFWLICWVFWGSLFFLGGGGCFLLFVCIFCLTKKACVFLYFCMASAAGVLLMKRILLVVTSSTMPFLIFC